MRFGPLSSNPFAVLVLSDVPFGQEKVSEGYITKDFFRKGTSVRHEHLRYLFLLEGCISKDARGYFPKGASLRAPLGDIFRRVRR